MLRKASGVSHAHDPSPPTFIRQRLPLCSAHPGEALLETSYIGAQARP
jgi:hypothetical protein